MDKSKDVKISYELIKLRPIPASREAEEALIGGLLLDNEKFESISKKLCREDFSVPFHGQLFDEMKMLHDKHGKFDATLVTVSLGLAHGKIYEIANGCASTANLEAYADIIREKSVQRQLIAVADSMVKQVEQVQHRMEMDRREWVASFLEEVAAEVRAFEHTEEYISTLITEMNLFLVRYHDHLFMNEECEGE